MYFDLEESKTKFPQLVNCGAEVDDVIYRMSFTFFSSVGCVQILIDSFIS